jgi:hypothetical protein
VGACTSVSQQDARAWLTVTEFGQQHMYKIPGKIQFALNITKIQTGKGDFYQTFYEWLQKHWGELGYKSITWNEDPSVYDDTPPFMDNPSTTPSTINAPYFVGTKQIKNPSSELMLFPFGLLIAQYDQGYNLVKKYYAENCRILSKSSSMDPNSPYVVEQGQIVPFRYVPTIISIKMKNKSVYVVPDDSVSQEHSNGATGGNGAFTPNVVVPSTSLLSAAPDLALAVNSPLSTFTT